MNTQYTSKEKEVTKKDSSLTGATTPIEKDREDQKKDTSKDADKIGTDGMIEDGRDDQEKKDDGL